MNCLHVSNGVKVLSKKHICCCSSEKTINFIVLIVWIDDKRPKDFSLSENFNLPSESNFCINSFLEI